MNGQTKCGWKALLPNNSSNTLMRFGLVAKSYRIDIINTTLEAYKIKGIQ